MTQQESSKRAGTVLLAVSYPPRRPPLRYLTLPHFACSCYTSEFMLSPGTSDTERFVFDPKRRAWIPFVRPHTVGVH